MTQETCGCRLSRSERGATLHLTGSWRLPLLANAWAELRSLELSSPLTVDGTKLTALDSAAALALLKALELRGLDPEQLSLHGFADTHRRVLDGVQQRLGTSDARPRRGKSTWLAEVGRKASDLATLLSAHLNFFGAALIALAEAIAAPRRLRARELTAQFEQVCLNAIPVVALVTLLIGVTIAYLLGLQAEKYGANIFVVDGVGIGMTREFAPIIVATIIAGRSGAAFTAQLGAMRLTEEIDAIRTLGLSAQQVLVVPRVLALMLALPLLVFVGDVLGIIGAMLVAEPMLGLTPTTFLERLHEALDLTHVWVGLAKAPVFALFIAVIGCRMGMTVERDSRAVGIATTSTVVQSIVAVILLDAAFAILFQELGL